MLAHLTAIAVAAFSLWAVVFVALPIAFHLSDKYGIGPIAGAKSDRHRRRDGDRFRATRPSHP